METTNRETAAGQLALSRQRTLGDGQKERQSLYRIETVLSDLLELREEMELAGEDLSAVDEQIAVYLREEIYKVDGIRAVWAHLEMVADAAGDEVKRQQDRKRVALAQLDRLKTGVQCVMEMMPWREGKPRKIEGQRGALYLKANGGKQAVEITDEALVPDEYCTVTVTMPQPLWDRIAATSGEDFIGTRVGSRVPSLSAIAAALEKPCPECHGLPLARDSRALTGAQVEVTCRACGGTGKAGVPGARLAARGQHVEVQ